MMTQGYGAPAVEQTFQRARVLCQEMGEMPQLVPVLLGLVRFYTTRAEYQIASELGEQLLRLAQHADDPVLCVQAHEVHGATLCFRGECVQARMHLEQSLARYDPQQCRALLFGEDPGVVCLSLRTLALWMGGYPDQALKSIEEALRLAQELTHPMSLVWALFWAAHLHQVRRERHIAQTRAEALITLVHEHGFASFWSAPGSIIRGWALAMQGQHEEGLLQLRQSVTAVQAAGQRAGVPYFLALLAEAHGTAGQVDAGLDALAEALEMAHHTGGGYYEPELARLRGELLLTQASNRPQGQNTRPLLAEAEAYFQHALAMARRQQARSWELRAAMSLGRLWQRQGQRAAARQMLAEIYGWFTEGFDTADLQEARALLAAWA
jgi:predicted ATPase